MPNDLITLKALTSELASCLISGKIDKVYMPEKDEILLSIRKNENFKLAISCNAQNPRIHLTNIKKENPIVAPPFCMLLRKKITGAIIKKLSLFNNDRIIIVELEGKNELHDTASYYLVAEMMGRYSNILLLNKDFIILDAQKKAFFDSATKRTLLPSVKYIAPENKKILIEDIDKVKQYINKFYGGSLPNYICLGISGFAKNTAEEICYRALKNSTISTHLTTKQIDDLVNEIKLFYNITNSEKYSPCHTNDNKDYFVIPYLSLELDYKLDSSLSKAIEECTGQKDLSNRREDKTKYLYKAYKAFYNKTEKKIENCYLKLEECKSRNKYLSYGEAISSQANSIEKGIQEVELIDYRSENLDRIKIKLNETLSPRQNAQLFFKKYQKLKRTEEIVTKQLEELLSSLEYLKSLEHDIAICSTASEIAEAEDELIQIGALRLNHIKQQKKQKPSLPLTYQIKDFLICVGKNNMQNEKLTFKTAAAHDIWIHTKSVHGSHTIIFTERRTVPDNVMLIACEIAAFYSRACNNEKVECDYTYKKFVKHHLSGKPGMVTYTNNKTMLVHPNSHLEYIIK